MNQINQKPPLPKWVTYTLIGVAIALIVSAILNIMTPNEVNKTPLTTTNYDQTTSEFSNLTYTGSPIDIPSNFNIAQASISDHKEELKNKLIQQFDLKQVQAFDVWTSAEWALTVDEENRFTLSSQEAALSLIRKITLSQATTVAQKFLDKFLPQYQVTSLPNQTEYFEGQYGDPAQTTSDKAQIIKVVFGYAIDQYPVFYKSSSDNFVEIFVDANGEIRKASFSTLDISLKEIDSKPALSPQVALQLVNQTNQAAIINTGYETPVELDLNTITSGKFDSVVIEYRVDPEQNLAYPFYRFNGFVTDSESQSLSAEIITPAIEVISTR